MAVFLIWWKVGTFETYAHWLLCHPRRRKTQILFSIYYSSSTYVVHSEFNSQKSLISQWTNYMRQFSSRAQSHRTAIVSTLYPTWCSIHVTGPLRILGKGFVGWEYTVWALEEYEMNFNMIVIQSSNLSFFPRMMPKNVYYCYQAGIDAVEFDISLYLCRPYFLFQIKVEINLFFFHYYCLKNGKRN